MYPNFFSFILPLSQAALRAAKQTKDGRDEEIAGLRSEIEVECAISVPGFSSSMPKIYLLIYQGDFNLTLWSPCFH